MEKDSPCKWKPEESRVAILTPDKINFKSKSLQDKKSLYNDKEVNSSKGHNNYKYIYTQHQNA